MEGWVYEVVNPVLDGLATELRFLDSGDVTWRFLPRRLEFIRPIRDYLGPQGHHILKDFERAQDGVHDRLHKHDLLLEELAQKTAETHDAFVARPDFQKEVWQCIEEYGQLEPARARAVEIEPWGAFARDEFPALVSEHVINGTREIASHHTDSRFWQAFGPRLLRYRNDPTFQHLDGARAALAQHDRQLQDWLESRRFDLCEEYDIPAAPLSSWVDQTV